MVSTPPAPWNVALIGAGRVGTAVAALLAEAGHDISGVASRRAESAADAARRLNSQVFELEDAPMADVFLLATPMEPIAALAGRLVQHVDLTGCLVVHFAGAAGIAPLEEAVGAGALACALHPVQACPDVEAGIRNLPGSRWGITASAGAEEWGRALVSSVGGHVVPVREQDRVLWHAAAVVTSNGLAALLAGGERILERVGVEDADAVLAPLARGTLENALRGGGGAATLTGPVVRGEADVIRLHMGALRAADPELADLYRSVSSLIASAAAASGRVGDDVLRDVRSALDGRP